MTPGGRLSARFGVRKSARGRGPDSRRRRTEPSKRLLLHIGTIKTGTSSIQETLNAAAASGNLDGAAYPAPLEMTHNHLAHVYASPDRLPRIPRSKRRADPRSFERIARRFKHDLFEAIDDNENLILSAEYLSGFSRADAAALARDLVLAGVGEVRVLAYVRDPASLYLSMVQQTLKASHLFVRPAAFRSRSLEALAAWQAIYPDVRVRPFVRDRLVDGDVVRDFLAEASSFFGDGVVLDDVELRVSNPSLSAEAMIVLQRYRRRYHPREPNVFKPDSTWLFRRLEQSPVSQTRPELRPEIVATILRAHADDLVVLAETYGVDLRPDVFDRRIKEADTPADVKDVAEILERYDEDIIEELMMACLRASLR